MSEVEKDAGVVAGEVESKETKPTTAEEKTEAPNGEAQTSETTAGMAHRALRSIN